MLPGFDPLLFPFAGPFDIRSGDVGGAIIGSISAGGSFLFGPGISMFSITGISPLADAGDPTVFPTFLDWTGTATSLFMTGVESASTVIPEPSSIALFLTVLVAVGLAVRRKKVVAVAGIRGPASA